MPRRIRDLTNQRFGFLVAKSRCGKQGAATLWLCVCDCGNESRVQHGNLRSGGTQSCGCKRGELHGQKSQQTGRTVRTNGRLKRSSEYLAYRNAWVRCNYEKGECFPRYGGRGIEFRFTSFEQFLAELGPKPSTKHTLERKDNDGHYEPGNVRWATHTEQARNTSANRLITYNGETLTVVEWAERTGLRPQLLYARFRNGVPAQIALTRPSRKGSVLRH